jgi:hypothetical protein
MVLINVPIPSIISIAAPAIDIHFLNKGALLKSQPVTPPNSNNGDTAVPRPNKTATAKLSIGVAKGTEYNRSITNGGHIINPLLKPSEKARTSNRLCFFMSKFLLSSDLQSHEGDLFLMSILMPIAIVTMLKAYEEYS